MRVTVCYWKSCLILSLTRTCLRPAGRLFHHIRERINTLTGLWHAILVSDGLDPWPHAPCFPGITEIVVDPASKHALSFLDAGRQISPHCAESCFVYCSEGSISSNQQCYHLKLASTVVHLLVWWRRQLSPMHLLMLQITEDAYYCSDCLLEHVPVCVLKTVLKSQNCTI